MIKDEISSPVFSEKIVVGRVNLGNLDRYLKRLSRKGVKKREFLKFFLFLFPQELTDFGQEKNVS